MIHRPCFFIVTGGPGAGKTSLIEALAALGYPTVGGGTPDHPRAKGGRRHGNA